MNKTEIVIIGAGPIGLAMAVRLMLSKIPFVLIERGATVGWNMKDWGHINMFTSWAETIDPTSHDLLVQGNIDFMTTDDCPSGKAFATEYLSKVADLIPTENLILNAEVTRIDYQANDKTFDIVYARDNTSTTVTCVRVLDASGTWGNFNQIVSNLENDSYKLYSNIPNAEFIKRLPQKSKIAVVGSGHTAMNSLLEISTHSQHDLLWLVRNKQLNFGKSKVGGKSESLENRVTNLIERNRIKLTTHFNIESITHHADGLSIHSKNHQEPKVVSHLISNIGSFPNYSLINGFTLDIDRTQLVPSKLVNKIDPSLHSCDTVSYDFKDTLVSEINYFVIGMKSFGKASNFLLSKGYKVLDELMHHLSISK